MSNRTNSNTTFFDSSKDLAYGPQNPDQTYVAHKYRELTVDLGEVVMNYAVAGPSDAPPLLLIPSQTSSWWSYEAAMQLLDKNFRIYAVDLRGQGRSSRTPGRYTLDNMGNDLVRFVQLIIGKPALVSGLSSGGVLAAWLSAYAPHSLIRAAVLEDPPLFHSELVTTCGHSIRQGLGPLFALYAKYLGDQWSIGDWEGCKRAAQKELPEWMREMVEQSPEPPQNIKEYDPEWGKAFWTGTFSGSCDHARMLEKTKVPVLLTHHCRAVDENNGLLMGALSDLQAQNVRALITNAGQKCDYQSFPEMGHAMHRLDPKLYASVVSKWFATLK